MKRCITLFIVCLVSAACIAQERYVNRTCDKCNGEIVKCSMCQGRGHDLSNRRCRKCDGAKTHRKQCYNCKSTGEIRVKLPADYDNPTNVVLRRWSLDKTALPELTKIIDERKATNARTQKLYDMMLIRYALHDYACKLDAVCTLDPVILRKYNTTDDGRNLDSVAAYMACQKKRHCDLCGNTFLMLKFEYRVFQVIDDNTVLVKPSCRAVVHGINPTHVVNETWRNANTFVGDIVMVTFANRHKLTDGDAIDTRHWLKYTGPASYKSVIGTMKTVRSFVEIDD